MRAYTLAEIDQMREDVRTLLPCVSNTDYPEAEDRLRTYMLNGTDPEDLRKAAAAIRRRDRDRQFEHQRRLREKASS